MEPGQSSRSNTPSYLKSALGSLTAKRTLVSWQSYSFFKGIILRKRHHLLHSVLSIVLRYWNVVHIIPFQRTKSVSVFQELSPQEQTMKTTLSPILTHIKHTCLFFCFDSWNYSRLSKEDTFPCYSSSCKFAA